MRIFWGRKISKYQKKLLSCEKSAKSFELTLKKDIYLGYSGDTPPPPKAYKPEIPPLQKR